VGLVDEVVAPRRGLVAHQSVEQHDGDEGDGTDRHGPLPSRMAT
jgi:hypothetical protein